MAWRTCMLAVSTVSFFYGRLPFCKSPILLSTDLFIRVVTCETLTDTDELGVCGIPNWIYWTLAGVACFVGLTCLCWCFCNCCCCFRSKCNCNWALLELRRLTSISQQLLTDQDFSLHLVSPEGVRNSLLSWICKFCYKSKVYTMNKVSCLLLFMLFLLHP